MIVKSVGIVSVAKVLGCLYALLGLVVGLFFSLFALAGFAIGGAGKEAGIGALVIGIGAVIFMPILYGLFGFIGGIIMALLYNVGAAIAGGIELDLQPLGGRGPE